MNWYTSDDMLKGICDIHLHAAPDSKARLKNELEFTQDAKNAGYKALLFKSNDFSCHDRAYLIREMLPGFEVFGSLCMNRVHGDKVNVFAAQKAVRTTGIYADAYGCLHKMPSIKICVTIIKEREFPCWMITARCCQR